jgi:hypothetical protein
MSRFSYRQFESCDSVFAPESTNRHRKASRARITIRSPAAEIVLQIALRRGLSPVAGRDERLIETRYARQSDCIG